MNTQPDELGAIARSWFDVMRDCGDDVRELLHDGHPTACVADAAFAYVNAFRAHVNVGFCHGAELPDPTGLLEGTGMALAFVAIVGVEVVILVLNGMTCPLTRVAARHTGDRRANFDIYLPEWLARNNKRVFGTLYVVAILFLVARWAAS